MAYQTPEQIAAKSLAPLGFINVNDILMPYSFKDKAETLSKRKQISTTPT